MIDQINVFAEAWFGWMYSMFWQVSLLIIIISLIDLAIKKWAWPQVRYALWLLVLLKLVIPPTWTFSGSIIPHIRSELDTKIELSEIFNPTSKPINYSKEESVIPNNNSGQLESAHPTINYPDEKIETVKAELNWKSYLMVVWVMGIFIFGAVLISKIAKLKKWHREQEEKKNIPEWFHEILVRVGKTLSVDRLPAIVFSNEALSPAVYGIFRPVLLLPENYLSDLSEEEAEHVLLHELAHIKRGDLIVHGICLILQIFYWFNPFLIWSRKQMKHIREICCDLTIANILREKTKQYKETLISTARELLTENSEPAMGLLGLFEEPFQLIARLKWLNKDSWKERKLALGTAIVSAILFTAFVLPMGERQYGVYNISENISYEDIESDGYRELVEDAMEELNDAFIKWDFEKIRKFYTEDAVIDQEGRPSVSGLDNFMSDLKMQKAEIMDFKSLKSIITDYWIDGKDINVFESQLFSVEILDQKIPISGTARVFTIWEIQDDESVKVKYSILNIEKIHPIDK